ncbi:Protein of unknown function [Cotesia congregata]|uniref:Uncharacterized protein n=1 Tax=Cotesia congregata TaxID=51543 RepID=A0A8J2HH67_COTCN|nr:Protein of unknown function [Cotesia congregata]
MITKILFIGLLFQATFQASKSAGENSKEQNNSCVKSREQCHNRNNICCDPNEKCELIGWRLEKAPYVCKIPTKLGTTLGEYCWENNDCMDILHMECSKNYTCVCKPNHISKNNAICVSLLNEFCSSDHDCGNLMHVTCTENKCACRPHHRLVQNTTCSSLLGGFCESNKECEVSNSIC